MNFASRRLTINAAAMLVLGVAQRAIGLVQISILARVLDVRDLGAITFMQSTATTFSGLAQLGTDAGLHVSLAGLTFPHDRARATALLGQSLTIILGMSFGIGCLMALLGRTIATDLYSAPDLAAFVVVSACLLVGQLISQYCYVIYAGLHIFAKYSRITIAGSFLSAALTIVGALGNGAWGGAIGLAAAQAATLLMLAAGLRSELRERGLSMAPKWPAGEAASIFALGLPFYASVMLVIPAQFATLAFLSRSTGVEALGELRVTQALMSVAAMIPAALSGPMISHLVQARERDGGLEQILAQTKAIWGLTLCLAIPLAAVWPFAVDVVFGTAYVQARSVGVLVVAVFMANMPLSSLTGALLAVRRTGALVIVGAMHAAVLMMAAWLMIGQYGFGGLLAAQSIGCFTAALLTAGALVHHFGWSFLRGWMLPLAVLTLLILLLLFADIRMKEPIHERLGVSAACLVVMGCVLYFMVLSRTEREALAHLIGLARIRLGALLQPLWRSPKN